MRWPALLVLSLVACSRRSPVPAGDASPTTAATAAPAGDASGASDASDAADAGRTMPFRISLEGPMPATQQDFYRAQLAAVVRTVEEAIPCAKGWTTRGAALDRIVYTADGPEPKFWSDLLQCGSKTLRVELSVGPGRLHLSEIVESAPDHVLTKSTDSALANLYLGRVLDAALDSPSARARSVWVSADSEWSPDPVRVIRVLSPEAVEAAIATAAAVPLERTTCPTAPPAGDAEAPESMDALEDAVFDAVMKSELAPGAQQVVVSDTGGAGGASEADIVSLAARTPCLSAESVRDYFTRNAAPSSLAPTPGRARWQLLTDDEARRPFREGNGWRAFRAKYPKSNGVIHLSRVGFSRDRRQAFLMASHQTGWLSGSGSYYVLQDTAEGWVILYRAQQWIS